MKLVFNKLKILREHLAQKRIDYHKYINIGSKMVEERPIFVKDIPNSKPETMDSSKKVLIVSEENKPIGTETRAIMRERCLIHRATFVFIFNSNGFLYVQKRSEIKDHWPGWLELCFGGVVDADEINVDESAWRELEEELGPQTHVNLTFHGTFFHQHPENNIWAYIYSGVYDGPINPQLEEVQDVYLWDKHRISLAIQNKEMLTGDSIEAYDILINKLNTS